MTLPAPRSRADEWLPDRLGAVEAEPRLRKAPVNEIAGALPGPRLACRTLWKSRRPRPLTANSR